ncbi:AraC family transcriptional regulator [Neorhizobium lilium]|uniref:AraC family transcriptional regulator n=1 Tax=Neorhizobium lilium TaxID=2503024 RepID=A0A444LND4_9HYPH|nr:AraC family transcriptional regulator [Neorhizobium lilium]RWX81772.1 AraC family transcriptional regulator [Neorhizobium lilium]
MNAHAALLDRPDASFPVAGLHGGISDEISTLLLRAATCVERDEANALDLMKQACSLLRPQGNIPPNRTSLSAGGLAPWQVKRLNIFIEQNISRPVSIEALASLSNLSTSYFSAAFKSTYGTSPHNHILICRVHHAKRLMLEGNTPLCEIALDCGLADQAHLSRVFRRITGTTPSAWRRHSRQMASDRTKADAIAKSSARSMPAHAF